MANVVLKKGRSKPVTRRHPWIFSGAIDRVEGDPDDGDIVEVLDAGGNWLARGYFNQQSQIRVRLLTWDERQVVDTDFWRRTLERAILARRHAGLGLAGSPLEETTAYRLVHAESDYLPGLIVDRYDQWLLVQFLTLGVDRRRSVIVESLVALMEDEAIRGVYERSDVDVREKEGLERRTGTLWGQTPPDRVEILENGHRFLVDIRGGHKTGFYLDQRENRARFAQYCVGAEVLDAFAFTGGFAVHAIAGGAMRVTLVDSSADALELARRNIATTIAGADRRLDYVEGNVFDVLRQFRSQGRTFDVIVLDPPKLAQSRRDVERASRAYKDVNLLALQLVRSGGVVFTFSCSGRVSQDLFQKIVFGAVVDSDREAQIIGHMTQGPDHPVALTFPEGAYLKGLICRVW